MGNSGAATGEEAGPLLEELRRIGYNPRVIRRANYRHHQTRRQWARVA